MSVYSSTVTDLVLIWNWSLLKLMLSTGLHSTTPTTDLNFWPAFWILLWLHVNWVKSSSLMLQPTASWPVCLGIKHPSGVYNQIFITVRQLQVCWCGAVSDKRMGLWTSPVQSFSGLSPVRLVTIFYCLRFKISLFVASYNLQGYGGDIQLRLQMGLNANQLHVHPS
jgi:hypothetical protein